MKKLLVAICALTLSVSALAGCSLSNNTETLSPEEQAAMNEIKQNDYRGSVVRTKALQQSVLAMMDDMKQNNITLRTENPNSFWTQEGYQDFVVNFLNSNIINDTQWFNEEEYDWDETIDIISTTESGLTHQDGSAYVLNSNVKIVRNEKDDYSLTSSGSIWYEGIDYGGSLNYRMLYDCDKDWTKAYAETNMNADVPAVTADLYEYARIDNNKFVVQTNKERLLVVLEEAAEDTDIRERKIKEFYYSKLTADGERTTFEPYVSRKTVMADGTYDEEAEQKNYMMEAYPFINEKGELYNAYGKTNSIFLNENLQEKINSNWVFEDKSLQQAIIFKDGALVVVTYNKLSENYERFVYTLNGTSDTVVNEIVAMIEIKNLVGTKKVQPSASIVKPDDKKNNEVPADDSLYGEIGESVEEGEYDGKLDTTTSSVSETSESADESTITTVPEENVSEEQVPETEENSESEGESSSETSELSEENVDSENENTETEISE